MSSEDEMLLISEVSDITGISVNTIRHWAKTQQLEEVEQRDTPLGKFWYTTVRAVEKRRQVKKPGRPLKPRKLTS